jgi:putative phosphoribosyl transferase
MKVLNGNFEPTPIWTGKAMLDGSLALPPGAVGLVLFAASGSMEATTRELFIAAELDRVGIGALMVNLLTSDERDLDGRAGHYRLDADFLAQRLIEVSDWVRVQSATAQLPIGYFGAGVAGAAALIAAAERQDLAESIVASGARTDLATDVLRRVKAPTLLVVAGSDISVLRMNREALSLLAGEKRLEIIRDATHLLDEPGAVELVSQKTVRWFSNTLLRPIAADAYGMVYARSPRRTRTH